MYVKKRVGTKNSAECKGCQGEAQGGDPGQGGEARGHRGSQEHQVRGQQR